MAKKEAFGLSLLDVLSNALVGGIVLMVVAASFIKVIGELEEHNDIIEGNSTDITDVKFQPIADPKRSPRWLTICFELHGGKPEQVQIYPRSNDPNQGACIERFQGLYEKQYWLVVRECLWQEGDWLLELETASAAAMPDSISIHVNAGLQPVALAADLRTLKDLPKKAGKHYLFTVAESARMPKVFR
ncbi:MAG: hypothetical protein AAB316_17185 [Bacteroidota bacterium]